MSKIPNWDRFDAVSDTYDDQFNATREPAMRLIPFAGIARGMEVLEIGAGTGIATRLAAEAAGPTGTVLATDIAPKMLAVARQKITQPNVEFRVTDGAAPKLPVASFDAVIANCVLLGFDNVPDVLRRWLSLIRPGGVVAFTSFSGDMVPPFSLVPAATEVMARYLGEMPSRFPATEVDSIDTCSAVLEQAGATEIVVEQHDLGYHYTSFQVFWNEWWGSLLRLRLETLERRTLDRLRSDLEASMAATFAGDGLYRPNLTLLARGRAPR